MVDPPPRRDGPFDLEKTALLVVDMQRIWLEPGLDPDHADRGPDHYFYVQTRERVIPNHVRLLAAARSAGVEVIHTIIQSLTENGRDRSLDHKLTPIHVPPSLPRGCRHRRSLLSATRSCCRRHRRESSTRPTSTTSFATSAFAISSSPASSRINASTWRCETPRIAAISSPASPTPALADRGAA